MVVDGLDLSVDSQFKVFAEKVVNDFIAFKTQTCKEIGILDALMKYASDKGLDEDLLGDCIKSNSTIKTILEKELENEYVKDLETLDEW